MPRGQSKLAAKINKNAPAKFDPSTLGNPPIGMTFVYNRLSKPYSLTFAGTEEIFEPHTVRMVHNDLGMHCERKSIYRLDPMGLHNVMVLVLRENEKFGVPFPKHLEEKGDELLIRDGQIVPKDVETINVE